MAKRQASQKQPTAKYRLTDLKISKVSLVDKPAVPGSVFVIAKRREDDTQIQNVSDPGPPVVQREKQGENDGDGTSHCTKYTEPNAAVETLCKSVATLCERLEKLAERLEVRLVPLSKEPAAESTPEPVAKSTTNHQKRLGGYMKLLNAISKEVSDTKTVLRNATGELPPDEET